MSLFREIIVASLHVALIADKQKNSSLCRFHQLFLCETVQCA